MSRRGKEGAWYGVGIGAIVLGGVLVGMMVISEPRMAKEPDPSDIIRIAPASGGETPETVNVNGTIPSAPEASDIQTTD